MVMVLFSSYPILPFDEQNVWYVQIENDWVLLAQPADDSTDTQWPITDIPSLVLQIICEYADQPPEYH